MPSIAMCCNFYNDAHALPGLLEASARYFDNLFLINSGPGGARSNDGSIEIVEKFGATLKFDDMDKGFGVIRSRLIRECGCEWGFILDADERFYREIHYLTCDGDESWPANEKPNLTVTRHPHIIAHGDHVRNLMTRPDIFAIRSTRRHWFDFSMTRPSQNWLHNKDHQLRIVRNIPEISYSSIRKMHEQIVDSRTGGIPQHAEQDDVNGPFHDHFHLAFRFAYPGSKEWNEKNYSRLDAGEAMLVKQ